MGLDTVELVMEVEETFGIEISDAAASRMTTPRELIDYLEAKIGRSGETPRSGMRAFFRIRAACLTAGIGTRRIITPGSTLEVLFPKSSRKRDWPRVGEIGDFDRWPKLQRPRFLHILIWIGAAVASAMIAMQWSEGLPVLPIGLALLGLLTASLYRVTGAFRTAFPRELNTIRDLVIHCVTWRPVEFRQPSESLDRDQIAALVKEIVCRYANREGYREDAHFVRDLGLD